MEFSFKEQKGTGFEVKPENGQLLTASPSASLGPASLGDEQLLCVKGRSVNNVDREAPGWRGEGLHSLLVCCAARKTVLDGV